jgi:hypothetical protein
LFVLPVIAIYTIAAYWLFRDKLRRGRALENPFVSNQGRGK